MEGWASMSFFITAFITLFVIVDPLGNTAVFAGLAGKMNAKEARITALKATIIAICVMMFFGFVGKIILSHMGISPAAFKIAGGLLLFYTAFNMVMGGHSQTAPKAADSSDNIAVFPMAIPLMAGPGCATAFILLLDTAREQSVNVLYVIAAMVLVEFLTFIGLVAATRIMAFVGEGALGVLARVTGIFIAALAVQFILNGLYI